MARRETEPVLTDLRQLERDTLTAFGATAEDRGLYLRVLIAPELPVSGPADPAPLRQIVFHLVDSGLRCTDEGGVTVRFDGQAGRLSVSVSDTGVGSPPEGPEAWLEAQHDGRSGPNLIHHLADLLDAAVRLESDPDEGSTVTVELNWER